ncbi:MAG TPA: universal stress protein, partial [Gaiellaceae bacterium]|nr:universal stress protein [Gaiellaceae bacterium]
MAAANHRLVVVGYDGSQGAEAALLVALEEARRRNATLRVVAAWHVPAPLVGATVTLTDAERLGDDIRTALTRVVDDAVAALRAEDADVDVEAVVVEGPAVTVLLGEAADAELLVV